MSGLTATGAHSVHTHVWYLGTHDDAFDAPRWAWVAIGPAGSLAGVERDPDKAASSANCARFLVAAKQS